MTVIAGALVHLRLANLVDARVTDVCPVGRRLLHQGDGAGGARSRLHRQAGAQLHHFLVRTAQRHVQKSQRIEYRMRHLPEGLENAGASGFRRARAFRMPTHAIQHDQHRRIVGRGNGHPVLIFIPVADEADIGCFYLQRQLRRLC